MNNPIENYKDEIVNYQIWLMEMKEKYGNMIWNISDLHYDLSRRYALKMVERILKLSPEQIKEISDRVEKELRTNF